MKASTFICECIAVEATLKVLEEYSMCNSEAYIKANEELNDLENYAEDQCEDFNDDYSYDPELIYFYNPIEEILVWECGLGHYKLTLSLVRYPIEILDRLYI